MSSQSISLLKSCIGKDKPWAALTLAAVVVAISIISMPSHAEWLGGTRALMGTEVSVQVWHDDKQDGLADIEEAFAEVARIEGLMSTYIETSEISRINRDAAQGPVAAGDELINLILRSLDISLLTRGAFDITFDSVGSTTILENGIGPMPQRFRKSSAESIIAWSKSIDWQGRFGFSRPV